MIDRGRLPLTFSSIMALFVIIIMFLIEYIGFMVFFMQQFLDYAKGLAIFVLVESHIFVILAVWSYVKCVATGPGYLSRDINNSFADIEGLKDRQKQLNRFKFGVDPVVTPQNPQFIQDPQPATTQSDSLTAEQKEKLRQIALNPLLELTELGYCLKCNTIKLPRTHHCKQCKRCVARMDHHCPWVANCVGLHNHKFFILFLAYTILLLVQILLWELFYFYLTDDFQDNMSELANQIVKMSSIVGLATLVSACFLGFFQIYLLRKNITTVEMHIGGITRNNPFNKGSSKNIEELFGTNRASWFLPIDPIISADREALLGDNL